MLRISGHSPADWLCFVSRASRPRVPRASCPRLALFFQPRLSPRPAPSSAPLSFPRKRESRIPARLVAQHASQMLAIGFVFSNRVHRPKAALSIARCRMNSHFFALSARRYRLYATILSYPLNAISIRYLLVRYYTTASAYCQEKSQKYRK